MSLIKNALAAALLLPLALTAQAGQKEVKQVVTQEPAKSWFYGVAGLQLESAYLNYGTPLTSKDVLVYEPYVVLVLPFYEDDGFVNSLSLDLEVWNATLKESRNPNYKNGKTVKKGWSSEYDYTVGLTAVIAKNFTLSAQYTYIQREDLYATTIYNGKHYVALDDAQNVKLTLRYDDSEFLGAFALRPHVTYLYELDGNSGGFARTEETNQEIKNGKGSHYEVGITPSLPLLGSIEFTVPIKVGFGSGHFFNGLKEKNNNWDFSDQLFGYASAGLIAEAPISFIPAGYGAWKANLGFTYYRLNKKVAETYHTNPPTDYYVVGGGISVSF